jgi:outer membrane lipoprotein-sorting protein
MAHRRLTALLIMGVGLLLTPLRGAPAQGTLADIRASHARVRDMVLEVQRKEVREAELRRMQRSAGSMLEFSRLKVLFMAPDRIRFEGRRGLVPVTVVQNGNVQVVRFGLGLKSRQDLAKAVRRKQSGLEFGLLPGEVWDDYAVTEAGTEEWDGHEALVLQLRAHGERQGSSFQKVWVDPQTHRVVRRDRFSGDGKLKTRQVFKDPYRSPAGTWLSKRIEVYNQNGKFVGALEVTDIRVNEGVAESLFRT